MSEDSFANFSIKQLINQGNKLVQSEEKVGNFPGRMAEILRIVQRRVAAEDFAGYCKKIGISPRMAYYLLTIKRRLDANDLQLPDDVSWRKLSECVTLVTFENAEEIFDYCRSHTQKEIKAWAKNYKRD